MFNRTKNALKNAIRSWLNLTSATGLQIQIDELLDFEANAFVNEIWFRGESYEIEQLYESIPDYKYSFWGSNMTKGLEIRKIHTGLPKIIVNTLTNICVDDMQDVKISHIGKENTWAEIEKENDFKNLVKKAVKKALVTGDGAFKISVDTDISQYPIIEFYEADRIEVKRERGRVKEIRFKKTFNKQGVSYVLKECYGYGYIEYKLYDAYDNEIGLDKLEKTKDLQNVYFDNTLIMAEYLSFFASDKWEGRGQSIFDSKRDNFDALDEAWSQWIDALRANRTKTYIPEDLLPRDATTGAIKYGNPFDNRFIATGTPMQENATSKIETQNGTIDCNSYMQTYITALDLCLQGLISPSTLGIDTKKLDNAEAQREKEKTTLYTRQTIIYALQECIQKLIDKVFKVLNTMQNAPLEDTDAEVTFGEYANPSFESQIETVGKAKTQGVMSIESIVEELYGDSKTDEWKAEEVKRIKEEQGIAEMEMPSMVGGVADGLQE